MSRDDGLSLGWSEGTSRWHVSFLFAQISLSLSSTFFRIRSSGARVCRRSFRDGRARTKMRRPSLTLSHSSSSSSGSPLELVPGLASPPLLLRDAILDLCRQWEAGREELVQRVEGGGRGWTVVPKKGSKKSGCSRIDMN